MKPDAALRRLEGGRVGRVRHDPFRVNMKVKKLVAPWDMDAIGRRVVWEGQLCTWRQYRTHAYLVN
jgi:hypothetical protein